MTKTRLFSLAAVFAALLFLLALPASAQCDPTTDPSCRLSPLQSRQVNPAAQQSEGTSAELEASGAPESVQVSDLPLVAAGSLSLNGSTGASSELRVQSPELGAQVSGSSASSAANGAPSFSSLDLRMRYQDPSDVSCGVQALGMALAGVASDGLESPASSALLGFLQGQGMMYDFGTGVEELAYAAGSFGFKGTQPFHGWSLADLRAELVEGRPVVVALGSNGEGVPGHFVTVTGLSEDGQWISYNDPTLGKITKSIDEFNALWGAQGHSGVSVRSPSSLPAGTPDNLPLLALMAGIMALVSATPMGRLRQGVGGKIVKAGNGANSNAPPHPAPAGKRWRAKTVPVYDTKTVQEGWTTVSRQVPIKEMVREQVGTRTYFEKIPKFKTITVQDGHRWVSHKVAKYKTVSYVKGYRYQTRRVPSYRGWRYVRQRVPVYGSKRIKVGTETKWRKVPKYVQKDVPDGYHTIERTKPVYALKEKIVGYKTVEKRVPRMVDKREQIGTKTEWELEIKPEKSTSDSSNSKAPGLSKPSSQEGSSDSDEGGLLWKLWDAGLSLVDNTFKYLSKNPLKIGPLTMPVRIPTGFGLEDEGAVVLYKALEEYSPTAVRSFARGIDEILTPIVWPAGWMLSVAPEQIENHQINAPIYEREADLKVDTFGFVLSEVVGDAVLLGTSPTGPSAIVLGGGADILTGIGYDWAVDNFGIRDAMVELARIQEQNEDRTPEPIPTPELNSEILTENSLESLGTATPEPKISQDGESTNPEAVRAPNPGE